jgi:uncharacterized protein involved in exopolysaccharide biosynthesis
MPDQQPTGSFSDDEISLLDLWHILWRRRMWVYATILAFVSAGIAYLVFKAPTYEASATLRIGQVAGSGPFEPPEVLGSRLISAYGEEIADGLRRERPFLSRAEAKKGVPATIDLMAVGNSPDDAAGLLGRVLDAILRSHAEHYQTGVRSLNDRLEALESQRASLLRQSEQAAALLTRLQDRDPVQASLVTLERGRISALLASVEAEKPGVVQRLGPPLTQQTELLREVVAPARPAAPKRLRIAAVAFVLGLVGGLILAFLAEFVARVRGST